MTCRSIKKEQSINGLTRDEMNTPLQVKHKKRRGLIHLLRTIIRACPYNTRMIYSEYFLEGISNNITIPTHSSKKAFSSPLFLS